jgi:hypothetical protein
MKCTYARLPFGATVWLTLGFVLALRSAGQNVAQPPPAGPQASPGTAVLPGETLVPETITRVGPAVTVERQGRRLVLNCPSARRDSALFTPEGPREEPPGFAVYQGQREIASGKFEYG